MAVSCTRSLCTLKALFIADNTLSNYIFSDFFDPQSSLLSVLQSQACTHKARESQDYLQLTFDHRTSV